MLPTIDKETVLKFDVPGPRYTSYPTAPVWTEDVGADVYREKLTAFGKSDKTLSLYIHIPFCESMCSYCACNVIIRRHEDKYGEEYLRYLFKELDLVREQIGSRKRIRQFHWGGGTPTFLNESQIERLFNKVHDAFDIDYDGEVAIEIDPRTIDKSKIRTLKSLGFNRISMGVQDFDLRVQKAVNRIQSYYVVREYYDFCRALGFGSVNFDLIYGLPYQTVRSFEDTVHDVIAMRPDRVALYSFAYVPWLKKHQNKIDQQNLPDSEHKIDIFLKARERFTLNGYLAIAMDHFALKEDELAKAFLQDRLYRNFMGYTVKPADEYIGLGLTSIGFLENTFIQNEKIIGKYFAALDEGRLPVERGMVLNEDDRIRQYTISGLMCHFRLDKSQFRERFGHAFDDYYAAEQGHLLKCQEEGLLESNNHVIKVTELGKLFIRNICMGFDHYLQQRKVAARFSRTV
ncbi:MAG: oxygen-independent coproporphyrinogen III oxidase [Candidatus Omnitrophica bacterium]|nr:oxygen-independent coproporphyrinogen III oxidase [Candidatus Omnitrophota bacterium]